MRMPILVACLALIYGTCKICADESVDLIEGAKYNSNYVSKYPNAKPLTESLSRYKRGLITSSLQTIGSTLNISPLEIVLNMLGLSDNGFIRSMLNLVEFATSILLGKTNLCPKVEPLSIDLIRKIMTHPIQTIETILCYVLVTIGSQGRAVLLAMSPLLSTLFFNIFLPGLHTIVNYLASLLERIGFLPSSLKSLINIFNVLYGFLKIMGYVP